MKSLTFAAGIAVLTMPLSAASGAVLSLGGPLSRLCYESALSRDVRSSALDGCDRALTDEPLTMTDRAATLVNRGILHMVKGEVGNADADFDAALALNRTLSDAWLNKGFLRLRDGKGREALPLLEEGIKLGPRRQALAYFARGVAHEQMGQFSSAYADLQRARDLEPRWTLPGEWLTHYQIRTR